RQVLHLLDILEDIRTLRNGQEPVIPDQLVAVLLFRLLGLDAPDDPALHDYPRKTLELRDHDHIQRIAILPFGLGNEPEIIREYHPRWQDLLHLEERRIGHIIIFLRTTLRGLDNNIYSTGHDN